MAENVVLPKYQRSGQQAHLPEVILLRDVEAQDSLMSTVVVDRPPQKSTQKFPTFIVVISLVQVLLCSFFYNSVFKYGFCLGLANV